MNGTDDRQVDRRLVSADSRVQALVEQVAARIDMNRVPNQRLVHDVEIPTSSKTPDEPDTISSEPARTTAEAQRVSFEERRARTIRILKRMAA